MLNTIRLNPFFAQGPATLAAKDRPLLPRNVDYSFGVMHVDHVALDSFVLQRDGAAAPDRKLSAEAHSDEVVVRVQSPQPLAPGAGYSVYGLLAGKRQRVLQFQTGAAEDRTPPGAVQVSRGVHLARFQASGGLCDDGHARFIVTVSAQDSETPTEHLRYLVEGAGEPQWLTAWCRLLEVRLPPAASGPLRITAVDLAGNRGPTLTLPVPPSQPGSWDAVRAQRECVPAR